MSGQTLAERIVDTMYNRDWFSQWLGIERVLVEAGKCILKMKVRKEMLNGFDIAHGGICYSLADSALAFASNSHGRKAVSVETSISHLVSCKEGDILTATAEETSLSNKIGIYNIVITNQENKKVALFKGTVYRTSRDWFPDKGADNRLEQIYRNKSTDGRSEQIYKSDADKNDEEIVFTSTENQGKKFLYSDLTYKIIGIAFEVFNQIGGGQKEVVYHRAMKQLVEKNQIEYSENVHYPVKLENITIGKNYLDFLINKKLILELKATGQFSKAHFEQVLNYLKVSKLKLALLINFTFNQVKIKRVVNFEVLEKT